MVQRGRAPLRLLARSAVGQLGRSPGAVADQVRNGREPQDRQGARPCDTPSILLRADEVIE
jgi:hypothetical protein